MEAKNINSSFFKKPYISLESTDLEKSSNIEKVICILVWLIIQTLGNFLIIGIIQYERFGGDPLKRRITDQVKKKKKKKRKSPPDLNFFSGFSSFSQ